MWLACKIDEQDTLRLISGEDFSGEVRFFRSDTGAPISVYQWTGIVKLPTQNGSVINIDLVITPDDTPGYIGRYQGKFNLVLSSEQTAQLKIGPSLNCEFVLTFSGKKRVVQCMEKLTVAAQIL